MRDSKNIVIGMLCAVICVMAVAYAAFSTTLNVTTTATVASNWCIQINEAETTCPTSAIETDGAAGSVTANVDPADDGLSAVVTMSFTQPGDTASCEIVYENCGSLNATVEHVAQSKYGAATEFSNLEISETGVATFQTAANGIEFTASGLNQTALAKNGGKFSITVVGKFLDVEGGQVDPTVKEAKIKILSTARQAA